MRSRVRRLPPSCSPPRLAIAPCASLGLDDVDADLLRPSAPSRQPRGPPRSRRRRPSWPSTPRPQPPPPPPTRRRRPRRRASRPRRTASARPRARRRATRRRRSRTATSRARGRARRARRPRLNRLRSCQGSRPTRSLLSEAPGTSAQRGDQREPAGQGHVARVRRVLRRGRRQTSLRAPLDVSTRAWPGCCRRPSFGPERSFPSLISQHALTSQAVHIGVRRRRRLVFRTVRAKMGPWCVQPHPAPGPRPRARDELATLTDAPFSRCLLLQCSSPAGPIGTCSYLERALRREAQGGEGAGELTPSLPWPPDPSFLADAPAFLTASPDLPPSWLSRRCCCARLARPPTQARHWPQRHQGL